MTRMGTAGYKNLRFEFNTMWDGYDPWGSVLEWLFALAETAYHAGLDIPSEWEFHDSPAHHAEYEPEGYEAERVQEMYECGEVTGDDLITFGQVLNRYADILREAGKDY